MASTSWPVPYYLLDLRLSLCFFRIRNISSSTLPISVDLWLSVQTKDNNKQPTHPSIHPSSLPVSVDFWVSVQRRNDNVLKGEVETKYNKCKQIEREKEMEGIEE